MTLHKRYRVIVTWPDGATYQKGNPTTLARATKLKARYEAEGAKITIEPAAPKEVAS